MGPAWGHLTVKMSGHPPFGAQVILNGNHQAAHFPRRWLNSYLDRPDHGRVVHVSFMLSWYARIPGYMLGEGYSSGMGGTLP